MWLALLVLFVALSPGVLFTLPAFGKKVGGKFVIAAMHSLLFVVVVGLLNVMEGFQVGMTKGRMPTRKITPKSTPEQTLASAEFALQDNIDQLAYAKQQVVKITRELESSNFQINELRQQLATVQEANLAAQNKVNERNQALSAAQKEVLDTTTSMNMITNKISSLTRGAPPFQSKKGAKVAAVKSPQQHLIALNNDINNLNAEITRSQAAVTAAKLAVNASKNVQRVEQAPSSMDSGSKAQDVAQATAVATTAQVDAEKAVKAATGAVRGAVRGAVMPVTGDARPVSYDRPPPTIPGKDGRLHCANGMYRVKDETDKIVCIKCGSFISTGDQNRDRENAQSMNYTCSDSTTE